MINHILSILWKQFKETLKNKTILIQFLMFPVMTIIMENTVTLENMPEHFFTKLFAIMYVGMAPLTCLSSIIAEEREKNTLKVLIMSNIKAFEYLIGNAIYIILACTIGTIVMGIAGGYTGVELSNFIILMIIGHIISMLVGAIIGICSKTQMMATSITVPIMMVFAFLPMISIFNEPIQNVAKYIFSEQLYLCMNDLSDLNFSSESGIILGLNFVLAIFIFVLVYKKSFKKR